MWNSRKPGLMWILFFGGAGRCPLRQSMALTRGTSTTAARRRCFPQLDPPQIPTASFHERKSEYRHGRLEHGVLIRRRHMRTIRRVLIFLILLTAVGTTRAQPPWKLIWSDEFNGPADSTPDPTKWTYDLGNNNGWGNQELEVYTNSPENSHMNGNGHLAIHVESASSGYTSARLKTQGLFTVQYGRIEARIKVPSGQGIWPAFWTLGSNIDSVNWPQCGEIDIMENIGKEPGTNHGSVHGPGYSGSNARTAVYVLPGGAKYSDDFHTFSIQWSQQAITFYVDGTSYETITRSNIPGGANWVFDHPFFVLLNVAVGGTFPGPPDSTTQFPQDMLVDYVRVYQTTSDPAPVINAGGVVDAATYNARLAPGSIATSFGTGMAVASTADSFDQTAGAFKQNLAGTSVFENGVPAALIFVSPGQINFQVPWETLAGTPLNVEVALNGVLGNPAPVTFAPLAPSVFSASNSALMTCSGGAPSPGAGCSLWANGLGSTKPPQQDGVPSGSTTTAVVAASCTLVLGGVSASVKYCGAAPGEIIYQLVFIFPAGVPSDGGTLPAILTVGDYAITFLISLH